MLLDGGEALIVIVRHDQLIEGCLFPDAAWWLLGGSFSREIADCRRM